MQTMKAGAAPRRKNGAQKVAAAATMQKEMDEREKIPQKETRGEDVKRENKAGNVRAKRHRKWDSESAVGHLIS
jgi:hypothetical protein